VAFERRVAVSDARPPAAPPPAAQPGGATATRRFFSGGWAFFLPYLSLYLLGFLLGWTNATVRTAFWVCHAVVMAGFSVFSYRSLRSRYGHPARLARDPAFWFWTLLALGFILPGAYLEFPSDPWEHFRRLHAWDPAVPLRHSPWVQKFAYFWGWTFFSLIQPKHQRLAADLYSAFWQMLLAVQLHRFAFRLIRSSTWAKIHVVGAIALFGNNTFSFFRYYALASTPLAYIAYLAAAIAVLDLLEGRAPARRALPTILAATVLVAVNHLEELLLVALFSLAAAFAIFWPRLSPRVRFVIAAAASASFLTSLLAGRGAMADPAAFGLTPGHFFQPYISEVGMFRLWDPRLSYFQTIGLPGMVAVFLALFLWRSHRLVSALTLAPVVALLYPGFAIPFANHVGEYSPVSGLSFTYRVLFLLPTSVMLITAFHGFAQERARRSGWSERPVQVAALATIILLGFHETSPVFGKLRFQYHRPSEWLQARYVDTVAQWLYERRPGQPWCHVTWSPNPSW
jgi:hypothetical protein